MSDITDSTNESVAFTMIGVVFGVGSFLGPLIGGVLSMPSEK
jgi:ABC-type branched-subunit amino acid transport system permease subunit